MDPKKLFWSVSLQAKDKNLIEAKVLQPVVTTWREQKQQKKKLKHMKRLRYGRMKHNFSKTRAFLKD